MTPVLLIQQLALSKLPKIGLTTLNLLRAASEACRFPPPDAQFKNPFVAFVLNENTVARQFLQGRLNLTALLNTEECKFLVEKLCDGTDLETVCSALKASNHNVGNARDTLAQ
jgi:hypothetical protein